jgi:hypothetical protein
VDQATCSIQLADAALGASRASGECQARGVAACGQAPQSQRLALCINNGQRTAENVHNNCLDRIPATATGPGRATALANCASAKAGQIQTVNRGCNGANNFNGQGSVAGYCGELAKEGCRLTQRAQIAKNAEVNEACTATVQARFGNCIDPIM